MEGLIGGNGEGEDVPRPRMWWEGGELVVPLRLLEEINRRRADYHNPEYWRRVRREQREREAMQRQAEEQEVAANRVAQEEAVLGENELVVGVQDAEVEAIAPVGQAEVKGNEGGIDASNEVDGDVNEFGGGSFAAENALEEEILERVGVTDQVAVGDAGTEDQEELVSGAVIFNQEELQGLIEKVDDGGSKGTGQDKEEVNTRFNLQVTEDDKVESQADDNNQVELPAPPKKKKRSSVVIPAHVSLLPGTPPKYRCNICQKAFKTKANIQFHRFCGQPNFLKPFQCPICDKGFNSKRHYDYHLRQHRNLRPYSCIFCQKGFYQQSELNRHLHAHTGEKPYMCQECPRCFSTSQGLKFHVDLIHKAKGSQAFVCAQCPKRFDTKLYLNGHVSRVHSLNRNPNFECIQCGKVFGVKANLDLHVRGVHLKERPHKCDLCSRAFFWQKDFQRHVATHTDERPLKCRFCDKGFKRKDNLDRHIRTQHGVAKENVADQVIIEARANNGKHGEEEMSQTN